MPRYTLCPYYVDENKKTISCEDVIRRFVTYRSKNKHMNKHCDKDWKSCPYAVSLSEMYRRIEAGSDEYTEKLRHKAKALEKENKKLISLLGRYDVRLYSKDVEIRQVRKKNRELDDALYRERKKRKELEHGKSYKQEKTAAGK